MRSFKVILALCFLALAAQAYAQLAQTGAGSTPGGSGPPPTCDGSIDLSKGCALPMLGGAP